MQSNTHKNLIKISGFCKESVALFRQNIIT